jgi:tetratricopeptide (TPR) repeat protein
VTEDLALWVERLREAWSALRRAEGLLAGAEGSAGLAERIAGVRAGLRADERDYRLAATVEEIRLRPEVHGQRTAPGTDADYAAAFRAGGIDVTALAPGEAAARLRARPICAQLATALCYWAALKKSRPERDRLARLALQADPDPWRRRLRGVLLRGDRQGLEELAGEARIAALPPAEALVLADAFVRQGQRERAVALLRQALQRHPRDFAVNHQLAYYLGDVRPPQWHEALRFYTVAVLLRPDSAAAQMHLGTALSQLGRWQEAADASRRAIERNPRLARAHSNLAAAQATLGQPDRARASCLKALALDPRLAQAHGTLANLALAARRYDEAAGAARKALALEPDLVGAQNTLAIALRGQGRLAEGIAVLRQAVARPGWFPEVHSNLGNFLVEQGQSREGEAVLRRAIGMEPGCAGTWCNLAHALLVQGRLDEATAAVRHALLLEPRLGVAHVCLGNIHHRQNRLDEAVAAYRAASALDGRNVSAHVNLGLVLLEKRQPAEAGAALSTAVRLDPASAKAHCLLGRAYQDQGRFAEAATTLRRGHELGKNTPGWRTPSAQWLHQAEALANLDRMLPRFLSGKVRAGNAHTSLTLARFCQNFKDLPAAAVRFYAAAFAAQPDLVRDPRKGFRYNAACAAALAAAGKGKDAAKLDRERARLRAQALDWLKADLAAWSGLVDKGAAQERAVAEQALARWQKDADLAGLRGEALAKLPAAEQAGWRALWQETAGLLERARQGR